MCRIVYQQMDEPSENDRLFVQVHHIFLEHNQCWLYLTSVEIKEKYNGSVISKISLNVD